MDSASIEAASDFRITRSVAKDYVVDDFFFQTIVTERPYLEIEAEPQTQVYELIVDRILANGDEWSRGQILFYTPIQDLTRESIANMCLFSELCQKVIKSVRNGYRS